jgi:signal transduction histidine kinase
MDGVAVSPNGQKATEPDSNDNGDEDRHLQLLGSVSSVMARELRNPISSLKMSFYSLARNFTSGVMAQQDLEHMDRSIKKMEKTISFLLNLSRDLNLNQEWVDVNELLDEVVQTLRPIMDPDVVIVKDYSPLPKMLLDREKMHTVFGNIIENALDAMPGGGRLRIITTENQGRVYVILEDTGLGVNQQVRDRIFEPFVTTKPDGVGLGLTVCKKIIGSHGGRIKLRSNAGKGTAVCIDIPVVT